MVLLLPALGTPVWGQTHYARLHSFGDTNAAGTQPHAALIQGADGALYGTTQLGGTANRGTVFQMNPDGSGYTVLHHFLTNPDGGLPCGALLQGQDGTLYGTTVVGGSNGLGTVFSLSPNGGGYAVLHHFSTNAVDGMNPYGGLVQDTNGILYGTAVLGGTNGIGYPYGYGAVFQLNTNGGGFGLVHNFTTNAAQAPLRFPQGLALGLDGALYGLVQTNLTNGSGVFKVNTDGSGFTVLTNAPALSKVAHQAGLLQAGDGTWYGTVYSSTNAGTVFKLNSDGSGYAVLHTFSTNSTDGFNPDTRLIQGADGSLYGTTMSGGTNGAGTVFSVSTDGTVYHVLYAFNTNGADGAGPSDALVQGTNGMLYGTTEFGGASGEGTVFTLGTNGTGYAVLRSFSSFFGDGQDPAGARAPGTNGGWAGVTVAGGNGGYGTVFTLDSNGTYTITHHFVTNGVDGTLPCGGLLPGHDGAWYGTTLEGGSNNAGTVFKLDADGGCSLLHAFPTNGLEGTGPVAGLTQGTNGMLYGTTADGGTNGAGTVFTLGTDGTGFAVLHHFRTNGLDGANPLGRVCQGLDGMLYGTTPAGGTTNLGTIYRLAADGSGYTVLYSFKTRGGDGMEPFAGLWQGPDGTLYGTTIWGGSTSGTNSGTVFALAPGGTNDQVLVSLAYGGIGGMGPAGELAQGGDGTLYGTAVDGGTNGAGGVFALSPDGGNFRWLQQFSGSSGYGCSPVAGLAGDGAGTWYGVTTAGGDLNAGTVFSVYDAGSPPYFTSQPRDQTAWYGSNATFRAAAAGAGVTYQWFFNSVVLTNATDASLTLGNVVRSNAGPYALLATNLLGGAWSSNAVLTVLVPSVLTAPVILADGSFQLTAGYLDGYALTAEDLARFAAQVSPDLTNWVTLTNALVVTNGALLLDDTNNGNQPTSFYRIIEQ